MFYRDMCGQEVSALGLGLMRLPVVGGNAGDIDDAAALAMTDALYEGGVNYWDSAYSYHNGSSERFIGRALPRYDREKLLIATKMPGHEVRPEFNPEKIFATQLERTGAGYFDYYLLHNVYEKSVARYMENDGAVLRYLVEQKRAGLIRHLGFSCHSTAATLERFLDFCETVAPGEIEFVQLQLNYMDWLLQEGEAKYNMVRDRDLDCVVMEPLRGGALTRLEGKQGARVDAVAELAGAKNQAEVALRWVAELEGAKTILSGMSTLEQVEDNLRIFADFNPPGEEARAALAEAARKMADLSPCTSCGYCTRECPMDLNIPFLLGLFDSCKFGLTAPMRMQADSLPKGKRVEDCIHCGMCVRVCPQNIDISGNMGDLARMLAKLPDWNKVSADRVAAEKADAARGIL